MNDIRTAAQRHVEGQVTDYAKAWFVDGAIWGAARVTPTRLQIAEVIAGGERRFWEYPNNDYDREQYLAEADKILALMAGLAEGEAR